MSFPAPFPLTRMRRLRGTKAMRNLVQETKVTVDDLVAPLFLVHGTKIKNEIGSLPGQYHLSIDSACEQAKKLSDLGINAVLLFGLPEYKDELGSSACQDNGIIQQAIRALKESVPNMLLITDLCFCEYTSHGHCGAMQGEKLLNDQTLEMLVAQALSHAKSGADIIAPSGMIDGCIRALRQGLDAQNFTDTVLMAYSAKFSSSFYGPFREAVDSTPQFGDRKTYQMNPANAAEALREVALDIEEGADIVMIKPALAFLDIIRQVKDKFGMPTAAYNVSGEYAMVKAAGMRGWIDEKAAMNETLLSIKRAGADVIITYFAEEFGKVDK